MITILLTDSEADALLRLLDLAVRQGGIGAVDAVAHFKGKLVTAKQSADTAKGNGHDSEQLRPSA